MIRFLYNNDTDISIVNKSRFIFFEFFKWMDFRNSISLQRLSDGLVDWEFFLT